MCGMQCTCNYTVSGKKGTNSIFHFYNLLEIFNKAVIKYHIAPKTRHYTTL